VVLSPDIIQADESTAEVTLTVNIVSDPVVYTWCASGVGMTQATLRGWLADLGTASSVQVSFGWDTVSHAVDPTAYACWTAPQVKTGPGYFKTHLLGLSPCTTYYFRAKAVGDTTVYGAECRFTTRPGWLWWWMWWMYFRWK
jgi:hypothetical protein